VKKLVTSIGIVGPQGSGKTFLAKQYALQLSRVIVFDPLHDPEWPGATVNWNPREAARLTSGRAFKLHYCPREIEERKANVPGLDYMASLAWQRGNCTLMVEEAHTVLSSHTAPPYMLRLCRVGRNHGVSTLWISHRFTGIHPSLRLNATKYIFFRITEPLDLDAIAKRCGAGVSVAVSKLRRNAQGITPQRLEFDTGDGEYKIFE